MENKHPILYNYYSKYSGGTAFTRLSTNVPNIIKTAKNYAPDIYNSIKAESKSFMNDVAKGVRYNVRDNISTNLLQGNNPLESFTKNIKKRLEEEPEYNNLRSKSIASTGYVPSYIKNIRSSIYIPEKDRQLDKTTSYDVTAAQNQIYN